MDPHVITLPGPLRYFVVKAIAIRRSKTSSAAYDKIWTSSGGPLRDHAEALAQRVRQATSLPVEVGMRYGRPSFADAHESLKATCDEVLVITAYPQYANSTYQSTVERLKDVFSDVRTLITPPYFQEPAFIEAHKAQINEHVATDADHLLLSFHGVPELHIRRADTSRSHCLQREDCCAVEHACHETCYRFQCLRTADLLKDAIAISDVGLVSIQTRSGKMATTLYHRPRETISRKWSSKSGGCVSFLHIGQHRDAIRDRV